MASEEGHTMKFPHTTKAPSMSAISPCLALAGGLLVGCAGTYESAGRSVGHNLTRAQHNDIFSPLRADRKEPTSAVAGNLAGYLRLALKNNPDIRADFERWQASVYRISRAHRLPEPTINFRYFIQSVETRVGPQRARLSLQQAFPWPTRLSAGTNAASAKARAMQRRFDAQTLSVAQRVETAYWNLWQIRTTRSIHREHLDVLRSLSESVRARMSTGAATLADLQQLDLAAARTEDNIHGMDEAERAAEASLRALIGVKAQKNNFTTPTPDEPGTASLPIDSAETLSASARTHPMIASLGLLAEADEAKAQAKTAERFPSFTVGADWIITGKAAEPSTIERSGQDAVIVGAGIQLPLWQGSYSDSIKAAKADARAHRAEQQSLVDQAEAELASTLAHLRDTTRRVDLYRVTLVPLAETAYASVLGSYTVGRGTVAQALLSQRDLLELRIELERARADHARTWARLEALVGRELRSAARLETHIGEKR